MNKFLRRFSKHDYVDNDHKIGKLLEKLIVNELNWQHVCRLSFRQFNWKSNKRCSKVLVGCSYTKQFPFSHVIRFCSTIVSILDCHSRDRGFLSPCCRFLETEKTIAILRFLRDVFSSVLNCLNIEVNEFCQLKCSKKNILVRCLSKRTF